MFAAQVVQAALPVVPVEEDPLAHGAQVSCPAVLEKDPAGHGRTGRKLYRAATWEDVRAML